MYKLVKFSSNPGKLHFGGLVHLLRYIRDNNTLALKYYSDRNDAPISYIFRQASIKNDNQLIDFSDSSWQDCTDTVRSTGAYIIFYQGGTTDHGTHVTGPFSQSSAEIEYNVAFTAGMTLSHFRMLIHELLHKDPDVVPE